MGSQSRSASVHPRIRAIGPMNLHLAKGGGPYGVKAADGTMSILMIADAKRGRKQRP